MKIFITTNTTPIVVLQEIVKLLSSISYAETESSQLNIIQATDMLPKFKAAIQQLEEQGKQTQFTNVAELWNQIETEAKKQPIAKKGLRLCKVEGNTDSFYFHEFIKDHACVTSTQKAPQHQNIFIAGCIGLGAVVEDKKGNVFVTEARFIKFID